jgi:hypothetical protein
MRTSGSEFTLHGFNLGPVTLLPGFTRIVEYTVSPHDAVIFQSGFCNVTVPDTQLSCVASVGIGGPFFVRMVSLNRHSARSPGPWVDTSQQSSWIGPLPLQYDVPEFSSVFPLSAPAHGGARVFLRGLNFGLPTLGVPIVHDAGASGSPWTVDLAFNHTTMVVTSAALSAVGNVTISMSVGRRVGNFTLAVFNVTGFSPVYGMPFAGLNVFLLLSLLMNDSCMHCRSQVPSTVAQLFLCWAKVFRGIICLEHGLASTALS